MIKVGILSYGMSGKVFHGPFLKASPHFEVTDVLERSKTLSSQDFPDATIHRDLDSLLSSSCEWLIVNTPVHLHFQHAQKALNAGKHIIIEKPICPSVEEALVLQTLAKDKNLHLVVYQNRRWDSDYLSLSEIYESNKLGAPIQFKARFQRYKPALSSKLWKEQQQPGTGVLYDLGSHLVDQCVHLFGKPESVFATLQKERPNSAIYDSFTLLLKYKNGLSCELESSLMIATAGPKFELHGSVGSFVKFGNDTQESQLQEGVTPDSPRFGFEHPLYKGLLEVKKNETEKTLITSPPGNYGAFYEGIHQLHNDGPSPVNTQEVIWCLHIIECALKSHENQTWITPDWTN